MISPLMLIGWSCAMKRAVRALASGFYPTSAGHMVLTLGYPSVICLKKSPNPGSSPVLRLENRIACRSKHSKLHKRRHKRRSFQRVRMEVYGASCIRNCWTWWMLLSSQWPWEWQLNVNSSHTGEPYLGMNQPHWVLSSFDLHNLDQQVPAKGTFWAHTHSCST